MQISVIVSFIERISNSHGGISRPKSVGAMIINIGQPFAVSYSAPIAHFSKRYEDPPSHNGQDRVDIAEFGPIRTRF